MSTLDIGLDDELGTPRMATDGGGPNRNGNRRRGGGAKRKKTAPVRILGAEEQEDGRGLGASEDESEFVLLGLRVSSSFSATRNGTCRPAWSKGPKPACSCS